MLGDVIAGAVIGAGGVILSQFINSWNQSRSNRYVKKIEYLQSAQEKLLELLSQQISTIPSLDVHEIIIYIKNHYSTADLEGHLQKFPNEYIRFIPIFFQYRHNLESNIRLKCDSYYKELHSSLLCLERLSEISTLQDLEKRQIITNLYTLSSLVFIGMLKSLESISDEVTK